jgi:hypothetical protein
MKDVVDIYLNDERAEPYRKMDLEANEGIMPQATVLNENICFCLIKVSQHALSLADERSLAPTHTYQLWPVRACCLRPMRTLSLAHEHLLSSEARLPHCPSKPTYDQCADPLYTMLRANLPTWHKHRALWRKQQARCNDDACACKKQWFDTFTSSETALVEGLLCKPVKCPELTIEEDKGEVPSFHKPSCSCGECDAEECLKAKLEQLHACKIEFPESTSRPTGLVRYRKYVKMPRKRNDGSEFFELEFVYVKETGAQFSATMLSASEAYLAHRGAHFWAVRQRKLCIEKLKQAGSLARLVEPKDFDTVVVNGEGSDGGDGGESGEAPPAQLSTDALAQLVQELLSTEHPHHLTLDVRSGVRTDPNIKY